MDVRIYTGQGEQGKQNLEPHFSRRAGKTEEFDPKQECIPVGFQ